MTERKHEADKCIISPAACVLVRTGRQSIHPRHVAVRTPTADEWWPPLSDREQSVSLWMMEMYERSDQFLSLCPLRFCSFLCHGVKITVISPSLEEKILVGSCDHYLNLNPHLYIGKDFSLTSVPAVSLFSTFLSPSVSIISFVCGCGFEWSCVPHVVPSQRSTGGHCLWLGDTLKMSLFGCALVSDTVYPAPMISPPKCSLLLCLRGIMNGK